MGDLDFYVGSVPAPQLPQSIHAVHCLDIAVAHIAAADMVVDHTATAHIAVAHIAAADMVVDHTAAADMVVATAAVATAAYSYSECWSVLHWLVV